MLLRLLAFSFLCALVFAALAFAGGGGIGFVSGGHAVARYGWPSGWLQVDRYGSFRHTDHVSLSVVDWGACSAAAFIALLLSGITVVAWPNHALQRTEAGHEVGPEFQP